MSIYIKKVENFLRSKFTVHDKTWFNMLIACMFATLFLSFVAGYYWGKHYSLAELQSAYGQEALTDRLAYGLALQCDSREQGP